MKLARLAIVPSLLIGLLLPALADAGTYPMPPYHCRPHFACNPSLGVALRIPPTWMRMPAGKEGPCTLSFARRAVSHLNFDERLIVKLVEVGNTTNNRALARAYANTLVRSLHAAHARLSNTTYGLSPTVVIRGLPPTPHPAVYVVVSHTALVYLFIAPGKALDAHQRQALASLHFFSRQGASCH